MFVVGGYKMCTILLPIKPEYDNKIVDQTKLYEYRKNVCKRDIDKIIIYDIKTKINTIIKISI